MSDIFSDDNKVKSNWAKWTKVGDSISGTYISKREVLNRASGQMQWVYELKLEDGSIWNVGGKPAVDTQMRNINLGQIIGFKFMEERPNNQPGKSATKIIQVYQDKDVIDKEWLAEKEAADQKELEASEGVDIDKIPGFEGTDKVDPAKVDDDTEKIELINELAKAKLKVEKPSEVKLKVMEATGMAFTTENYDAIIKHLSESK